MPVKKRFDKRRADLSPEVEAWLAGDRGGSWIYFQSEDALVEIWRAYGERIVEAHVADFPGTRPQNWWTFSAPRQPIGTYPGVFFDGKLELPRQRIGGVGTPKHEVLAYVPNYHLGVPSLWIEPSDVELYNGRARDIHGQLIILSTRHRDGNFQGLAIDRANPPMFELQATFLDRHDLLLPGERRRLQAADFRPERITDILGEVR